MGALFASQIVLFHPAPFSLDSRGVQENAVTFTSCKCINSSLGGIYCTGTFFFFLQAPLTVFDPVSSSSYLQVSKTRLPLSVRWMITALWITCGCSLGKEEVGSSWPVMAELQCKAAGAKVEGTSRSRRCMEEEDLGIPGSQC